jgi:SSS family solute:Na+ symporter
LAGKANSIATIYTLDIYKKAINPNASEEKLVSLGRVVVIVAMAAAVVLSLLIGEKLMGEGKQGFQYIQEYTGFVSPGIFAMFILGFFWKKTSSNAAMFATIGGFVLSIILKFLPQLVNLAFLAPMGFAVKNKDGIYEIPFLDRMGFVFLTCVIGMYIISNIDFKGRNNPQGLEIDASMFRTSRGFAIGAFVILATLTVLYTIFW